jgi:hypothetical protein
LGISPLLLEKDFWVSWLLNVLFNTSFAENIIFKGGTSLSKSYGIIKRFSEDIDITIDTSIFPHQQLNEPLSGKKLQRLLDENNKAALQYIDDIFKPTLEVEILKVLKDPKIWNLKKEESDPKNIRFFYPSVFNKENHYVKKSILLEVGVKGRVSPFEITQVVSYVEKSFENILQKPTPAKIRTLVPVRTFWEKITLMHAENHRPIAKLSGDRLSRHYYDVHQLIQNGYGDQALNAIDLLIDVIDNKKTNFRSIYGILLVSSVS